MNFFLQLAVSSADINEALVLMVVGMGVVGASLVLLMGVVATIKAFVAQGERKAAAAAAKPAPTENVPEPAPKAASSDELAPELIVVLSAAVAAVLQKPVRIRRAQFLRSHAGSWAQEGRRTIMTSHRPKR